MSVITIGCITRNPKPVAVKNHKAWLRISPVRKPNVKLRSRVKPTSRPAVVEMKFATKIGGPSETSVV
jgi:hypothetical protein